MKPEIDRREVYRYLGLGGAVPVEATVRAVEEAIAKLEAVAEPRQVSRRFALRRVDGALEIEGLRIESHALERNLTGCDEVFAMAATLGIGPDRLIARAQASGAMHRAVTLQAAAAAMIEAWCDAVNEDLRWQVCREGLYLRPRFSPGYGDFSLNCQSGLFQLLNVQRRIGVTLTESLLMIPTKSVTAIIGISAGDTQVRKGCAACARTDCRYRDKGRNAQ